MGAVHLAAKAVTYRSDAGRPLAGGGGIVPDVRLDPDTLTTPEQSFGRALEGKVSVFRDALTATALEIPGGVLASLPEGSRGTVAVKDEVRITALRPVPTPRYAQPAATPTPSR